MRRRLWWQICLLDRQGFVDRGTDPIITVNSFNTAFPLHVNDDDWDPDSPLDIPPREEYTDMTFPLVCHEVLDVQLRLNYVPAGEHERSEESTDDPWAERRGWVMACQRRIEDKYLRHCNVDVPGQRYTFLVGQIIFATMWLFAYRPLQRPPISATSAKMPHPGILDLAVQVTERALEVSKDFSAAGPFQWTSATWVQWHALAVMIAELCVQTEGPTVERAWNIVDAVYEEAAQHVADSDKGKLWRPIKKLMHQAQAVRKMHLADIAAINTSSVAVLSPPVTQPVPWPDALFSDVNVVQMEPESKMLIDTPTPVQVMPQPQPMPSNESLPVNWDYWLAPGTSNQTAYNNELNQMSWTNWENFIDDFQANGDYQPAQDGNVPSLWKTW
jgi:hypothetical protein